MAATSGYDENELLWDILGPPDYNNLDEPTPWSNKKSNIMGLTITFMVRPRSQTQTFRKPIGPYTNARLIGIVPIMVIRLLQIVCAVQSCTISLVGRSLCSTIPNHWNMRLNCPANV
jgi:hypothetical protein